MSNESWHKYRVTGEVFARVQVQLNSGRLEDPEGNETIKKETLKKNGFLEKKKIHNQCCFELS